MYKIPLLYLSSCLYGVNSQSNKWINCGCTDCLCVCRFYHLFQQTPGNDVILLEQIFGCLLTKGINKSVTSTIMEMAYTFLGDDEGMGVELVLPHSKVIMEYLNTALKGSVKGCALEMAVLSQ